jgi:hypothetical protein
VPRYFLTASAVHDLDLIKEQLLDSGGKRVARYVFGLFRSVSFNRFRTDRANCSLSISLP